MASKYIEGFLQAWHENKAKAITKILTLPEYTRQALTSNEAQMATLAVFLSQPESNELITIIGNNSIATMKLILSYLTASGQTVSLFSSLTAKCFYALVTGIFAMYNYCPQAFTFLLGTQKHAIEKYLEGDMEDIMVSIIGYVCYLTQTTIAVGTQVASTSVDVGKTAFDNLTTIISNLTPKLSIGLLSNVNKETKQQAVSASASSTGTCDPKLNSFNELIKNILTELQQDPNNPIFINYKNKFDEYLGNLSVAALGVERTKQLLETEPSNEGVSMRKKQRTDSGVFDLKKMHEEEIEKYTKAKDSLTELFAEFEAQNTKFTFGNKGGKKLNKKTNKSKRKSLKRVRKSHKRNKKH